MVGNVRRKLAAAGLAALVALSLVLGGAGGSYAAGGSTPDNYTIWAG